jgi:hypothetical protein
MKQCYRCKENKSLDNYYVSSRGVIGSYCKICIVEDRRLRRRDISQKRKEWIAKDPVARARVNELRRKSYHNRRITSMYSNAKKRAMAKGLEFNIDREDIILTDKCPILEIDFVVGKKGNYYHSVSLDRIDSSKGYIKGNVRVISMLANVMKSNATLEQLRTFARNINGYIDDIVRPISKDIEI